VSNGGDDESSVTPSHSSARTRRASAEFDVNNDLKMLEKSEPVNPMKQQKSSNIALAVELTADGIVWRCSNPMAALLGKPGRRHLLFGLQLLHEAESPIAGTSLPRFAAQFAAIRDRLDAREQQGDLKAEGMRVPRAKQSKEPIELRVAGNPRPIYLTFVFDETSNFTDHSVALRPVMEGHAAITVTFVDVTVVEEAKQTVRRLYDFSYNDKLPESKIAEVFDKDMVWNAAGTQAPLRSDSLKKGGLQTYMDRRDLFIRAFPDMHITLLEQSVSNVETADGADAERVVSNFSIRATHLGPYHAQLDGDFRDIPPTSHEVSLQGIAVDVCIEGKIIDHAAYYDEAALVRQLRTAATASGGLTVEDVEEDAAEAAVQSEMEQYYSHKYLSQLATAATDTGFAVCVGSTLQVCMCSGGFPFVLGLSGGDAALDCSLLQMLERMCDEGAAAAEALALREAVRAEACFQDVFVCGGANPKLLLCCFTPFVFASRTFFTVVVFDWLVDPSLHSTQPVLPDAPQSEEQAAATSASAAKRQSKAVLESQHHPADLFFKKAESLDYEGLLTTAMHESHVGFSLADKHGGDVPMVWVSRGFERMAGFRRSQIVGVNCRRLQTEATDPSTVGKIREAIDHVYPIRVCVWNMDRANVGFWNLLSIHPFIKDDGSCRYFVASQARLSHSEHKKLVRLARRFRSSFPPMQDALPQRGAVAEYDKARIHGASTDLAPQVASTPGTLDAIADGRARERASSPEERPPSAASASSQKSQSCVLI